MKNLFKLCLSFRDTITRSQYLLGMLMTVLFVTLLYIISVEIRPDNQHGTRDIFAAILSLLLIIDLPIFLYTLIALAVKRLRDVGWSKWLAIFSFIPPLSLVLWLLLLFIPSKKIKGL
ncbi:MAG: DUF805 domain-containing protein [Gammaproteobacteria bacterium]|nr:DUF805 domain-containing protein [Gammaproteobacteria bacterium]